MDALDIMTNLDAVKPFFQGIFSAEEQEIVGYEVLGRIHTGNELISLGEFFWDESIPNEYKLEVEVVVIKQALEELIKEDTGLFFINQNPNVLVWDEEERVLNLLLEYKDRGLDLSRIVLEITEHHYEGNMDFLKNLISYYRTYGIKFAIDRVGKESSNLDRIRFLQPDIFKIDLHELKVSQEAGVNYQDVIVSLSTLARRMGATLLFEEVEDAHHLQYAFNNGGRYYQGYYLHKPTETLVDKRIKKEWLATQFKTYTHYRKQKLFRLHQLQEYFNGFMDELVLKNEWSELDSFLQVASKNIKDESFRLYICNEEGMQLTPNRLKVGDNWENDEKYRGKNWSWRPYFLDTIIGMKEGKKGRLSDLYTDIETGDTIRTFSYPIEDNVYLFIDLSYEYLYEQHYL